MNIYQTFAEVPFVFLQNPDKDNISVYIEERWVGIIARQPGPRFVWRYVFENLAIGEKIYCRRDDETEELAIAKNRFAFDFWEVNEEFMNSSHWLP